MCKRLHFPFLSCRKNAINTLLKTKVISTKNLYFFNSTKVMPIKTINWLIRYINANNILTNFVRIVKFCIRSTNVRCMAICNTCFNNYWSWNNRDRPRWTIRKISFIASIDGLNMPSYPSNRSWPIVMSR